MRGSRWRFDLTGPVAALFRCVSAVAGVVVAFSVGVAAVVAFSGGVAAAQPTGETAGQCVLEVGGDWYGGVSATETEGSWSSSAESLLRLKLRLGDYPWRFCADVGTKLTCDWGTPGDWSLTTELERAYLKVFLPSADLSLGRQQISWGVGYAWSPTDVFNPPIPASPEGLRPGVNALVVRIPTGPLAYWSFVAAEEDKGKENERERDRTRSPGGEPTWQYGARFHGNRDGTDWSIAAVRGAEATMLGVDAKGDLAFGGLAFGWHGEVAWHTPDDGSAPWLEGVLGADRAWGGGALVWAGEYFCNSRGAATQDVYDYPSWFAGDQSYLARHYGFTQLTYQHDEFTTVFGSILANLVDGSAAYAVGVRTLLGGGWQLSLSMTALAGKQGGEFAGGAIPGTPAARPNLMLKAQAGYSF